MMNQIGLICRICKLYEDDCLLTMTLISEVSVITSSNEFVKGSEVKLTCEITSDDKVGHVFTADSYCLSKLLK